MSIKFKLSVDYCINVNININFFFAGEIIQNIINFLPAGLTNSWLNRDNIFFLAQ